jgi:hypothetical protein
MAIMAATMRGGVRFSFVVSVVMAVRQRSQAFFFCQQVLACEIEDLSDESLAKSEALTEWDACPFRPEKHFHFFGIKQRDFWSIYI